MKRVTDLLFSFNFPERRAAAISVYLLAVLVNVFGFDA